MPAYKHLLLQIQLCQLFLSRTAVAKMEIIPESTSDSLPNLKNIGTGPFIGLAFAICAFAVALYPLLTEHDLTSINIVEMIVGFVVLWGTGIYISLEQQKELSKSFKTLHQQTHNEIHQALQHMNMAIHLYRDHPSDSWFLETTKAMSQIALGAQNSIHDVEYLKEMTKDFLRSSEKRLRDGKEELFGPQEENRRSEKLVRVVRQAMKYVHAVTYDSGEYFSFFWSSEEFRRNYLKQPIKSGVEVERIFVVRQSLVGGGRADRVSEEKRELMRKIVKEHEENELNMRIVCIEGFPKGWPDPPSGYNRSFLTCDDEIVSEAPTGDNGLPGYIHYKNQRKVEELERLFKSLKGLPVVDWQV